MPFFIAKLSTGERGRTSDGSELGLEEEARRRCAARCGAYAWLFIRLGWAGDGLGGRQAWFTHILDGTFLAVSTFFPIFSK